MSDNKNKTIVEKVTALLAKFSTENEDEQKFEDVKTTEGVVLRISELAEGGTVQVISEDGESTGSGDYVLEDGTAISVGEDGIITSVTPKEDEEVADEEMSEEEKAAKAKADAPGEDEDEDNKPSKFETETIESLAAITKALEGVADKFGAIDTDIKKINDAPDEEEFSQRRRGAKHTKDNALEALAKFRKKQS